MPIARTLAAVLAVLAAPAAAQDAAGAFADAFAYHLPGGADGVPSPLPSMEMIAALGGNWVEGQLLFTSGTVDPDLRDSACNRAAYAFVPDGPFAFTATRLQSGEATDWTYTYTLMSGRTFVRSVDAEGMLSVLFPQGLDTIRPEMIVSTLNAAGARAHVLLFQPHPDVLVVEGVGGPAQIFLRCP
ncbi:hypothetical protein [Wenxinia marina]|uniref:Uncharacterized protein n=1 Tax=Wenxinia marina DSM 24838 TaxID=1123501 RepID=A0A0D0NH06_9RHOB|nr:hypothetical protein [Wenxinia marina]KIQ67615.1 hypothetical protein Wenmar_04042 [Wenxinia marina DSM 24838]GGL68040.1 hypothetical protein GCM10011392_23160 [Wenxinia marina]